MADIEELQEELEQLKCVLSDLECDMYELEGEIASKIVEIKKARENG